MTFVKLIRSFIHHERGLFITYIFSSALLAAAGLYLPWLVKVFIENLSEHQFSVFENSVLVKIFVCVSIIYLAYRKMLISIGDFVESNIYKFRVDILKKIIQAPLHEAKKNDFSAVAHHMIQDINGIEKNLIQLLNFSLFHLLVTVGIFSLMLSINWILFVFIVLFFIISVVAINYFGQSLEHTGYRSQQALLKTFAKIQDVLKGLQTIKIYGMEKGQIKKINALNLDYYLKTFEFIKKEALIMPFDYLLEIIGVTLVLMVGGFLVQRQQITIPYLFSFILYIELLAEPASHISGYIVAFKNIKNFLNRLSVLLKNTETIVKSYFVGEHIIDNIKKIELIGVSFHYPHMKRYIFKDINLSVKTGDIIGICGKNGSGKTTLVELLLGFLKPKSGEILINDQDMYSLSEKDWRAKISLMPQKSYFFEESLRNNLTLFDPNMDDKTLQDCIHFVGAEHIIANLPDGLETVLANHRSSLSGGEFQKLSLIRVLLMNPEIIILDEPFNHLDIQSCETLKGVITKIAKNKIVFIIEHHHEMIAEITNKTILLEGSNPSTSSPTPIQ